MKPNDAAALVKKEDGTEASPPPPPPLSKTQQARDLKSTTSTSVDELPKPQFMKSLVQLGSLSTAINSFTQRFNELEKHIDFIDNAIESRSNQLLLIPTVDSLPLNPAPITNATEEEEEEPQEQNPHVPGLKSEVEYLCEMMCSRSLRKYIISNLSNDGVAKLREEVPAALKLAPKPAKLVFDCIGRFFLQGTKAFTKDSPMIPARQASLLILELFLLSETETDIDSSLKEESHSAAMAWRKRLISEGGVSRATSIDAKGLLLFLASFGIPSRFSNQDVGDLIRLSSSTDISNALRCSRLLLARIPDIIEEMMKNGMCVEAVDVAYTFGVEEKFPPQEILTSFLRKSKEAWKRTRTVAHGSPMVLKEANEKQLAALKSVIKCLEDRKIDPTKLLPGWRIKENIINLEKEISDLDNKIEDKAMRKRKADEIESSNQLKNQEMKRLFFTARASPLMSPPVGGMQEQRVISHLEGKSSYDGLMPINLLDGELSGHASNYPAASYVPHGSGAGFLPKNVLGRTVIDGGGVHVANVGDFMSARTGVLSTGSYSGVQGEMVASKVEQMMNNNRTTYGWHGIGDAALRERSIGQSFVMQPASVGVDGLFRPSPSLEGFPGLPNSPSMDAKKWSTTSDLYRFADTVLDGEARQGSSSSKVGPLSAALPTRNSSYLY